MRVRPIAAVIAAACVALAAPRATAATNAQLVEQVRKAETGFAKSMADRDHAAFTSYLSPETVFCGGRGVLHGKQRRPSPGRRRRWRFSIRERSG